MSLAHWWLRPLEGWFKQSIWSGPLSISCCWRLAAYSCFGLLCHLFSYWGKHDAKGDEPADLIQKRHWAPLSQLRRRNPVLPHPARQVAGQVGQPGKGWVSWITSHSCSCPPPGHAATSRRCSTCLQAPPLLLPAFMPCHHHLSPTSSCHYSAGWAMVGHWDRWQGKWG